MKNITLKDIAKLAKVSVSTVSKSLNDSDEITEITKDRVRKIAKENNYTPNYLALSLRSKKTKTIGVVIPDILNYFFVKTLYGIEEEARKKGYKVITCISNNSYATEVKNISTLTNGSVDGIIMSLAKGSQNQNKFDHILAVIEKNIPVVLFDRVTDNLKCDKIISDNYNGARKATKKLLEMGCKNIALFTKFNDLSVVKDRENGYRSVLKANNLLNESYILNINDVSDCENLIQEFLVKNNVDAILSTNELLAIKTIKVANKVGKTVPNKLKVIGFSNGILAKEFYPSLSAIDLQPVRVGNEVVKTLIKRLNNEIPSMNFTKTVRSTLMQRDSTSL